MDLLSFCAAGFVGASVPVLVAKGKYSKIDNSEDLKPIKDTILNQGLYHVTTEEGLQGILESGYIRPSDYITSLGRKKTFFFAGTPDYSTLMQNVASTDTYEFSALKVKLNENQLDKYKIRKYSDNAVVCDGKCVLQDYQYEAVRLVLDIDEKGNIFSREKREDEEYVPKPELVERLRLQQSESPKLTTTFKNLLVQAPKVYMDTFKKIGKALFKKLTGKKQELLSPGEEIANPEETSNIENKSDSWRVSDETIDRTVQIGKEMQMKTPQEPEKDDEMSK